MAAGEVTWVGVEQVGDRNGRVALYLTESLPLLRLPEPPATGEPVPSQSPNAERAEKIAEFLARQGASFFSEIHAACGAGFPGDTIDALWELAWSGRITNDTFLPLRKLAAPGRSQGQARNFRRGKSGLAGLSPATALARFYRPGSWPLVAAAPAHQLRRLTPTQWSANVSQQLLQRHGIVMRETAIAENIPGGYNTIYPALKTMEDNGWVRRGMFVAGLGAAQFAMPAAVDMLRSLRVDPASPEALHLAAADPANPYGTLIPWPPRRIRKRPPATPWRAPAAR